MAKAKFERTKPGQIFYGEEIKSGSVKLKGR